MLTVKIRDIIHTKPNDFLTEFPKRFIIQFDDGEKLQVSRRRTYVSSFYWRVFHDFKDVPIEASAHVDRVLGEKRLQSSTHMKLASNIFKMVIKKYMFVKPEERECIQHHLQEATNDLYNGLRANSGRHLQTIHLMDCIELMYHPRIWEASINCKASPAGVEHVYSVIEDVIMNDPTVADNDMVKAVRSGSVKLNQVCQSIGVRGYPKELNGRIFRHLARGNYLFGMLNLYEFAADSRGSAEHLAATESPLQDSEYFSRRLQLQTCVLERIDYSDCGTKQTIPFYVKPAGVDAATDERRQSSLKYIVGKIYIDPKTGKELVVSEYDKHLEGTTIQMRSVLTCEHPDPHAVCQHCFGTLANNHSRWANLGVVSSTTVVSKISQKTLGTKHHISSGHGSGIVFTNELRKYFVRGPKNTDYVFQPNLKKFDIKLVVTRDSSLGLVDVMNSDEIDGVNPERITGFEKIRLLIVDKKTGVDHGGLINIGQDKRTASMSLQLLEYIRQVGFTTDSRNNFVINLSDWNFDDVVFTLPDIQVSFSAHGNAIAELVESKLEHLSERATEDAPLRVLSQLFDMVTSKLDVNIAALECIVYSLQQVSVNNFSMGRLTKTPILGIGKQLIWQRSLGTAFAFQEWSSLLIDPKSYDARRPRPSTPIDAAIDPRGYLYHHSKTYVNGKYRLGLNR